MYLHSLLAILTRLTLRWEISAYEAAISPNKEYLAWIDRHSGDLSIWQTPFAVKK